MWLLPGRSSSPDDYLFKSAFCAARFWVSYWLCRRQVNDLLQHLKIKVVTAWAVYLHSTVRSRFSVRYRTIFLGTIQCKDFVVKPTQTAWQHATVWHFIWHYFPSEHFPRKTLLEPAGGMPQPAACLTAVGAACRSATWTGRAAWRRWLTAC